MFFDGGHTVLVADFYTVSQRYPDSPFAQYANKVLTNAETDDEKMAAAPVKSCHSYRSAATFRCRLARHEILRTEQTGSVSVLDVT